MILSLEDYKILYMEAQELILKQADDILCLRMKLEELTK